MYALEMHLVAPRLRIAADSGDTLAMDAVHAFKERRDNPKDPQARRRAEGTLRKWVQKDVAHRP